MLFQDKKMSAFQGETQTQTRLRSVFIVKK